MENEKTMLQKFTTFIKRGIIEIFFVVVGILIAVSINNWNENIQHERELSNILLTVKEDLKNDLQEIEKVVNFYEKVKGHYSKVLNDSLTREDYENNRRFRFLILGYPEISFDKRGYNLLKNFNYSTNNIQDSLISNIVDFYTERLLEIQVDIDFRSKDFEDNYNYWKNNEDWWAQYISFHDFERFIDYALSSQDYKNRVATARFLTYDVYLPELVLFQEQATEIIELIEEREKF